MPFLEKESADGWTDDMIASLNNLRRSRLATFVILIAVLAAILIAGLWPFVAPRNEVTWEQGEDGIIFGEHGTMFSKTPLKITEASEESFTLELCVRPADVWATGTILAFYNADTRRQFSVAQSHSDLLLRLVDGRDGSFRELRARDAFSGQSVLLAITSGGHRVSIYADGHLVLQSTDFPLSSKDLSGQIILANSALRDRSWSGRVKRLAIFGNEAGPEAVQQHDRQWNEGEPAFDDTNHLLALYLFREHSGEVTHSAVSQGPSLSIPERFSTVDQLRFESPVSESRAGGNYLKNALFNIVGFIPLGMAAALFIEAWKTTKRVALAAAVLGGTTSLAIEYLQSYLPTRYSGVTDLMTNSIGCWMGAMLFCIASRFIGDRFGVEPTRRI